MKGLRFDIKTFTIIVVVICFIGFQHICFSQLAFESPKEEKNAEKSKEFDVSALDSLKNIVPVVVIGSGPAGLTAAMYTARAKLKTLVITGDEVGGQLTEASYVENWPSRSKMSGLALMNDSKAQAQKFGAEILSAKVKAVNCKTWPFQIILESEDLESKDATKSLLINALSFIIATGGSQRTLDIPGVKEFWGKGIGVCSICDAPFDQDKDVAIIGGGDAAGDRALQLSAYAKNVTLLVRGPAMRAAAVVQDYLKSAKNISMLYNVEVKKIVGKEHVEGVEILDTKTSKASIIPVESVYFALGFVPRSDLFKGQFEIDKDGYIKLYNNSQATSVKGVFAAGTVEDSRYQKSATAAGNGAKAGMDTIDFLQTIGFNPDLAQKIEKNYFQVPKDN